MKPVGTLPLKPGGSSKYFAAWPLFSSSGPTPAIVTSQASIAEPSSPGADSRRDFEHHRPILQIEIEIDIVRRGIGRGYLEAPVRRLREEADVVVLRANITEIGLPHRVGVDEWHAPDDRLHRAALDGAAGEIGGGITLHRY